MAKDTAITRHKQGKAAEKSRFRINHCVLSKVYFTTHNKLDERVLDCQGEIRWIGLADVASMGSAPWLLGGAQVLIIKFPLGLVM